MIQHRYVEKRPIERDKYYCGSKENVLMTKVMRVIEVNPLTKWRNVNYWMGKIMEYIGSFRP